MTALSGEKTLAELSAEFGVHPTMISGWKQELMTRAGELFARGNKAPAVADAQRVIDDLHRKIGQLLREGISVGRRRVRRLTKKLGLWAVRPKRNTSKRHPEHKVYPYLLRGKTIDQPNQSLPSRKRGYGQLT
jgi:transposase